MIYLKPRCANCGKRMSYHLHYIMIRYRLWARACKALGVDKRKLMCRPCVEEGLGRPMRQRDLTDCHVNDGYFGFDKSRLAA